MRSHVVYRLIDETSTANYLYIFIYFICIIYLYIFLEQAFDCVLETLLFINEMIGLNCHKIYDILISDADDDGSKPSKALLCKNIYSVFQCSEFILFTNNI